MTDQASDTTRQQLTEGLLAYGATFTELGRLFAVALGVHTTDAFALLEITAAEERGTSLSPAQLGKRIRLSSGAMTALLNRLERAGYVTRTRDSADRRVVTLHATAEAKRRGNEFFDPINARQDAILASRPPELLREFEKLLRDLQAGLNEVAAEQQ
ncbi:MarR family winged helix-turn-helix transcriptional regulator [Nocardia donostiensis]|nr:MarR family transcriptional regulator [Nocardia donostiensis]